MKTQAQQLLPRVKNMFTATQFPKYYESNHEPSLTVPDQTLPLKTILERHARGLSYDNVKVPIYHGEEPLPDFKTMDLSEIADLRQQNMDEIKRLQENLQAIEIEAKMKTEQDKIARIKSEAVAEYKAQSQNQTTE